MSELIERLAALEPAKIALPEGFHFAPVDPVQHLYGTPAADPTLGALAAFTGTWTGTGFNTIFRPESSTTPTVFHVTPDVLFDNVLELNLTEESITFSPALGSVPNRGLFAQADAFLNGVPYLQSINDVTIPPPPGQSPPGIHAEPGIWMCVPPTNTPAEPQTIVRMASIPHGTTVMAQGVASTASRGPVIPDVDITPFNGGGPLVGTFTSQDPNNAGTARIPQDLGPFIATGTITPAMLKSPNELLKAHIAGLDIIETTTIEVATETALNASTPSNGGGTDNIAFLVPNADATMMKATFWIETVEHTLVIPIWKPGNGPLLVKPEEHLPGQPLPTFSVEPPFELFEPIVIKFRTKQIQYSQTVILQFANLSWPHVSVATLVPSAPVHIPPIFW